MCLTWTQPRDADGCDTPRDAARVSQTRGPDQLHLACVLWTRAAGRDWIVQRCQVRRSVWTGGRYPRRWGCTPQQPWRLAYEQDPAAVRRWLQREDPAIRALARRELATLCWGDETGRRSAHHAGRSDGRRGQPPILPGTGKRFRCTLRSAITTRGTVACRVFEGSCITAVFLGFLRRVIRHAGRRVFLIVDEHPVHGAAGVERWVKRHRRQVRLGCLPGSSPALTPEELLHQDVKSNAGGRTRPRHKTELLGNVRRFMRSTPRRPAKVRSSFRHPNVRDAA